MMPNDDYGRIEAAIRFLESNFRQQPSLAETAAHIGLSEYHFERLFARWAGLTPKRFMQVLTAQAARERLAQAAPLLDVAYEGGLSSGSRLHDLCLNVYAMSPGELRTAGRSLRIAYGIHPTPFGNCLLATTEKGVCSLHFLALEDEGQAIRNLQAEWPHAVFSHVPEDTQLVAERIFRLAQNPHSQPLNLLVKGTNFQIRVWEALLRIPPGQLITYEGLAASLSMPRAARAVGSAVGRNGIGYLIPCHRVIRKSGAFGDYRWGLARKKAMLAWESVSDADRVEQLIEQR